jgi:nuclear pore complex protein Nup85
MSQFKAPVALEMMDESLDFIDEMEQEVDPVSKVLLTRFEEAPIPPEGVETWRKSSRVLKFKLNPNGIDGVGFISQDPHSNKTIKVYPQETKIYTSKIPMFDDDELYTDYVSDLYGIYQSLGDEKYYSVPTTGLIKRNAQREQIEVLNKAMDLTVEELQSYIQSKRERGDHEGSIFELEEALFILNCLKALYFTPDHDIPQALGLWVNMADPQPDKQLAEDIMQSHKPYTHRYFWKLLTQLALRGLYKTAASALKQSQFEELLTKDELLYNLFVDTFNLLQSYPENSPQEIFKQWKLTAAKAASNASIRNPTNAEMAKNLRTFLNILAGNKNTILNESTSWYEALIGLIYYHIPSSELIGEYFTVASTQHRPDHTSIWELACVDIFEGNFLQTLRAISSFNTATSAYVAALCEAKGLLKGYFFDEDHKATSTLLLSQDLFSTTNPSEFLLHTHALDCLSVPKLIPVGIGLLASSRNPTARSVIAEYLPKFQLNTSDDIEWALTICASLKLPQIAHVIFRTAAQRSLSEGLLLEALNYFARAGEVEYVKHRTWLIFESSLMHGAPIDDAVINATVDDTIVIEGVDPETMKSPPLLRQTLAPYAVLYQFWSLKKEGSLRLSLTKLISLLKFPFLPPRLFGILIAQLLPFIIFAVPPKVLLKKDLLTVVKILDKYEEEIFSKTDKKNIEYQKTCDELYQESVGQEEMANDYWVSYLKDAGVTPPSDLKSLLKMVRRNLAVEIGRAFMEDSYN